MIPMRMRATVGKVLLVVASVVATLVVVDVVLLVWHGPVHAVENFYEPDARFGYRMRPNLQFVFASPYHGYRATVRTNSRGLRDDEVAVPKPPGVFRILLLGDSMTAGLEVDHDQTFEAVCESRLRAAGGTVEVVNAGVRGYNLDNIVGWFENEGVQYEPDVVVYLFVDNDLAKNDAYAPAGSDISRGFTMQGMLGRVAAYSHLTYRFEILRQMIALRKQRDRPELENPVPTLPGGLVAFFTHRDFGAVPEFRTTARRVQALADLSAQHGAVFVLGGAPQQEEVDPEVQGWWKTYFPRDIELDFDGGRHYLDWIANALHVERLDPIPAFRAHLPQDKNYWFHKDGHLNARGHRLLGEVLAEKIEQMPRYQSWDRSRGSD
jgi:lysophospholipase L1-like esterase